MDANYEALKEVVLRSVRGRLLARGVRLDWIDLEAAYNHAWHGVCQAVARGGHARNLPGLLVDVTDKRAIDIYRQRNEALYADADVESQAVEVDLAKRVDDQQKIELLVERLKDCLNDVQRRAVALCVLQGYTRAEAARILGMNEAAFGKVMDRAIKRIAGVAAAMEPRGCGDDEWGRALRSYALGAMSEDSPDYARVATHIRGCASCKRYVMGLRGLAVLLPPLGRPGHGWAAPLSYLRRFFAPHSAVTAGAPVAGAASSTVAGTTAVTGGGWTALGSGAAKVAVVVGLATVGTLSIHALTPRHHPVRSPRVVAPSRPPSSSGSLGEQESGLPEVAPLPRERSIRERSGPGRRTGGARAPSDGAERVVRATPVARSEAVATEFGFERARARRPPAAKVSQPVASAPVASASHVAPPQPKSTEAHKFSSQEFSFEHRS